MNRTTNNMGILYCIEAPPDPIPPHDNDMTKDFYSSKNSYDHNRYGEVDTNINITLRT